MPGTAAPAAAQRALVLALLLGAAGLAWLWLFRPAGLAGMAMAGPTMGLRLPFFLAFWVVMMVAMMFPTIAPMVLTFHKVQAGRRARGQAFVATWVFVAGYTLVWALSGVAAYAGALAAEQAPVAPATAARVGGAMLVLAGLYQLTPLKDYCLTKCRTPLGFIMTSWREGAGGALRMGLLHGAHCLGCCWLLFAILFPLGLMNLGAMALVTVLVLAEKAAPQGRPVVRAIALGLVGYGALVLAVPGAMPTSPGAGMATPEMSMPGMAMPKGGARAP